MITRLTSFTNGASFLPLSRVHLSQYFYEGLHKEIVRMQTQHNAQPLCLTARGHYRAFVPFKLLNNLCSMCGLYIKKDCTMF